MNTAYNTNTTTVQDARNRYNALLSKALQSLNKHTTERTAQPETTAEDAPAMDMYHGYLDDKTTLQAGRIKAALDKSVRLDSNGPVLTWLEHINRLWRAGGLWGYKHLEVSTDYTSTDTKYIARTHWRISTPQSRADYDGYYTANKTVVEYVKYLLALSGEDVTAGDPTELETLRYDARLLYLDICKLHTYDAALVKTYADTLAAYYTLEGGKSKREVAEAVYNDTIHKTYKMDFCVENEVRRYLRGLVKQATEDEATAPEDTPAIEDEAPQQPEPVATPENVTTEPAEASNPEDVTATAPTKPTKTRRTKAVSPKPLGRDMYHIFAEKQSKWALLFDKSVYHAPEGCAVLSDNVILIESKLDYREEYSGKMILEDGTESKKDSQLIARYQKVYQSTGDKYAITPKEIEEQIKAIQDEETRTALCELFGKDMTPEEVKEELKYNKEARAYVNERTARHQTIKLLLPAGDFIHLAPKNLKTALKVAKTLATTCISNVKNILQFTGEAGKIILAGYIIRQEDENSMHPLIIDLADATPAPEEVQPVTTSKQEDTPYWLLLDNELRAQQQEQAPATPEKSEEEPMHAPQMLKKIIEEKKRRAAEGTNTTPLKTAVGMTTEVLTKKRAKELLGDDYSDYNTYILVDGTHVVRFDRPELSNTLYIDDESKEYKEYQRGNISAVELYRNDAIRLNDPARILDTIKHGHTSLKVIDVKGDVLVFTEYGGYHGCRIATPDEVEICKAAAREASEAFTKRLDSYIRRYGKKIYVHSYWANR